MFIRFMARLSKMNLYIKKFITEAPFTRIPDPDPDPDWLQNPFWVIPCHLNTIIVVASCSAHAEKELAS